MNLNNDFKTPLWRGFVFLDRSLAIIMKDHVACTTQDALRLPLGKDTLQCIHLAKGRRCEQHGLHFAEGMENGEWRMKIGVN